MKLLPTPKNPFLARLLTIAALPHELVHYGVARLLRVDARIEGAQTILRVDDAWQAAVITIAPAVVAVVGLVISFAGMRMYGPASIWYYAGWLAFAFLGSSGLDVWMVWKYIRSGEWPNATYLPEEESTGRWWIFALE